MNQIKADFLRAVENTEMEIQKDDGLYSIVWAIQKYDSNKGDLS